MRSLLASIILLSWTLLSPSYGEEFSALVTFVKDGDTFEARRGAETVTIRLFGIDCPEKGQPFADSARKFTEQKVLNQNVRIQVKDKDRYGRLIGEVFYSDRESLNQALVREGFAWHYKKHSKDTTLASLENQARSARKGLWRDGQALAPWDFRVQHRIWEKREQPAPGATTPTATPTPRPALSTFPKMAEQVDGKVIGNRRSKVYHPLTCPNARRISAANRIEFPSAEKAEAAGYRLCTEEKKRREAQ